MSKAVMEAEKYGAQIQRFRESQLSYEDQEYTDGKEFGRQFGSKANSNDLRFLTSKCDDTLLDPRAQWPFDLEDHLRDSGLQASNFAFLRGFIHGARDCCSANSRGRTI